MHPAAKAGNAGKATIASRTIMIEAINFVVERLKIGFFMSFLVPDYKSIDRSKKEISSLSMPKEFKKEGQQRKIRSNLDAP